MKELFGDEKYVTQEAGRILQQIRRDDNSSEDWSAVFKTIGLALANANEEQLPLVQSLMNEANIRHSFWLERRGVGAGSLAPVF